MTDPQLPAPRWDARCTSRAHDLRADGTECVVSEPAPTVRRRMIELPADLDGEPIEIAADLYQLLSQGPNP